MDAPALAAAIALAPWRHRTAIELDRPLGPVLNEKVLVDLARQRPASVGAVRAAKGMSPIGKQRAEAILGALAAARPDTVPVLAALRPATLRAQRWSEVLVAIVQHVAEHARVAPRLLATRADADEFARAFDERGPDAAWSLPALATWRREVIGQVWVDWLEGRLALLGDPAAASGIQLVPR
jgi:ribonuclease D